MNRYLKFALWAIAAVMVLMTAIVSYIAMTFDPNSYKPQIIQAVRESKHRTLKLDGDIKLRFFPSIGVSIDKVSLSEFRSEQEFASVDSVRVSLKLLPLLSKRIVVDEIFVSGIKAQLVKFKNGKTNIDDLLSQQPAPAQQAPAPQEAAAPMQLDITSVQLDETDLRYRDEGTGASYAVKDLKLKTGRIGSGIPSRMDFSAHLLANQPSLDLAAQASATLTIDLKKGAYQVQGLDLQVSGKALDITDLALKAAGDASARPAAQEFSLKKFTLVASGVKATNKFSARLEAPVLALTRDKVGGDHLALNASLEGALGKLAAALTVPAVEGDAHAFKVSGLSLDVDMKQPEQAFKLQLTSPLTGSVEAQQFNLSDLRLAVHATGDKLPGKSIDSELKGSIQADLGRQSIQANLAGGLLQSQIKAKAAVNNFSAPVIRYDLDIDQFDADPYLPKKTAGAKETSHVAAAAPEQPFDLSALKTLNLEGSLRVGSLKAANIRAAQVRVDVKARNGVVNVAPLSARLYQGGLDGKIAINAATNTFNVDAKLAGVEVGPLLKDAADLDLAEGKGNIVLALTTYGNTVSGLKRDLNGSASVNLAEGAIKGINLAKLVQGVQSLGKGSSMQTLGVDKNEKTEFSEFKANFKIRNGVAHNDDLAVKSTVLRVVGNGDIDIGHDSMDYNAKAIFAKTEQGKTATLPVNISGGLDDLKFKIDYGALLADVARQKLDEKKEQVKEEAKAKLEDELKKGLKGLFK